MYKKRTDVNQKAIYKQFKQLGIEYVDTSKFGNGFGDCIAKYRDKAYILEIKNPDIAWKLTEDEIKMHRFLYKTQLEIKVVEDIEDVLKLFGIN